VHALRPCGFGGTAKSQIVTVSEQKTPTTSTKKTKQTNKPQASDGAHYYAATAAELPAIMQKERSAHIAAHDIQVFCALASFAS
jgi:hypothetical protein